MAALWLAWLPAASSWLGGVHPPPVPLAPPFVLRRHAAVVANLPASTAEDEYEVTVARPLGITLRQEEGVGPVVNMVYEDGNAALNGIAPGDIVIATSASIGQGMWPKTTVAGVESAIQTRLDGQVKLRLRRASSTTKKRTLPWEGDLLHTYEVELTRPLGLTLRNREVNGGAARGPFPAGPGPGVEVANVSVGGSACASGLVQPGDIIEATSGTVGDALWEKSSLEGVLAALSTRLAIQDSVAVRLKRWQRLGPWAHELADVARGTRRMLSAAARASLLKQRRDLRSGILTGTAVLEALQDLAVQAALSFGRKASGTEAAAACADEARQLSQMLRRLRAAAVPVDNRLATAAMSAALRVRRPDLALAFFEQLDADGNLADARVYTTLIKTHAAAGSLSEALAVEQRMSAVEVEPTVQTYTTLMNVCAKAGDRRGMLKYFGAIAERGMQPTVESWNVVIRYCASMQGPQRVLQAEDVLRRMKEQGLEPDAVSYSSLAQACIRAGDIARLDALVEQLVEDRVKCDTVLLNTVLNGYARTLRWERAMELLRQWTADGVKPDATSYVHVLRACVGARVPERAAAVVQLMRLDGLQPDVRTYSMLLTAYAKAGMLRASLGTLKQMRSEGVRPNAYVYAGLMEACLVAGQPETAAQLFEQMRAQEVAPDAISYTLLLRALLAPSSRAAPADAPPPTRLALDVLDEMKRQGGECAPTSLTYSALVDGCLDYGEGELALKVLEEMLDTGLAPDRLTSAALAGTSASAAARPPRAPPLPRAAEDGADKAAKAKAKPARQRQQQGVDAPRVPRPAAATVGVLLRAARLFQQRRRRLGGDVYLAAFAAAEQTVDVGAAAELIRLRRQGVFQLRERHEPLVAAAEARASTGWALSLAEEEWAEAAADDAEARDIEGAVGAVRPRRVRG